MKYFRIKEVAEKSRLTERQVQHYTTSGVVKLPGKVHVGSGRGRRYSAVNVLVLMVVSIMLKFSANMEVIKEVINRWTPDIERLVDNEEGRFINGHYQIVLYADWLSDGFMQGVGGTEERYSLMMNRYPAAIVIDIGVLAVKAGLI